MPYVAPGGDGRGTSLVQQTKNLAPYQNTNNFSVSIINDTLKTITPEFDSVELKNNNLNTSFPPSKKSVENEKQEKPKATPEEKAKMSQYKFPETNSLSGLILSKQVIKNSDNSPPCAREKAIPLASALLDIQDWSKETIQTIQDCDLFVKSRRGKPGGLRVIGKHDIPINSDWTFNEYPGSVIKAKYTHETDFIRKTAQEMIASLTPTSALHNKKLIQLLSDCTSINLAISQDGNIDSIIVFPVINEL